MEILVELIRMIFASLAVIIFFWAIKPIIKYIFAPLPPFSNTGNSFLCQEPKEEIQIPQSILTEENFNSSESIDKARKSPMNTVRIIRQWLNESKTSL